MNIAPAGPTQKMTLRRFVRVTFDNFRQLLQTIAAPTTTLQMSDLTSSANGGRTAAPANGAAHNPQRVAVEAAVESISHQPFLQASTEPAAMQSDTFGSDTLGTDTFGGDTVGEETAGEDTVGAETLGDDAVGAQVAAAPETAGETAPAAAPVTPSAPDSVIEAPADEATAEDLAVGELVTVNSVTGDAPAGDAPSDDAPAEDDLLDDSLTAAAAARAEFQAEDAAASAPAALSLAAALESLLFVSDEAVEPSQLGRALGLAPETVEEALQALDAAYRADGRGLRLQTRNGRYQLVTAPEAANLIEIFLNLDTTAKLSAPALETLAVVAYRQPVTRAQIEAVRGVDCSGVLRSLLQRGLLEEVGRLDAPGRPVLYGVTDLFMHHFGLTALHELPPLDVVELARIEDALEQPAP